MLISHLRNNWPFFFFFFASCIINQALICKKTTPNLDFLKLFFQLSNQQLSNSGSHDLSSMQTSL